MSLHSEGFRPAMAKAIDAASVDEILDETEELYPLLASLNDLLVTAFSSGLSADYIALESAIAHANELFFPINDWVVNAEHGEGSFDVRWMHGSRDLPAGRSGTFLRAS